MPEEEQEQEELSLKDKLKKTLGALDIQRKSLEAESEGIVSELTLKPGPDIEPMGIDTPLVDHEGYPRNDIDVYRARTLRHRLAELRTDHKSLMQQIEQNLLLLAQATKTQQQLDAEEKEQEARLAPKPKPKYDPKTGKWVVHNWDGSVFGQEKQKPKPKMPSTSSTNTTTSSSSTTSATASVPTTITSNNAVNAANNFIPFAKIDSVAPQSPAEEAGLKENDLILQFGPIDKTNQEISSKELFQKVAQLVPAKASEHQSISILLSRQGNTTEVSLTPRPWNGRGLIGCHIIPYNE